MNHKKVGEKIRDYRNELGLHQSQFAEEIGTNQIRISEIERGKMNRPACESFIRKYLINPEWLFGDKTERHITAEQLKSIDLDAYFLKGKVIDSESTFMDEYLKDDINGEIAGRFVVFRRFYIKKPQHKVADEIGYSKSYVSAVEKGINRPSSEFIQRYVKLYNLDIRWLASGKGEPILGGMTTPHQRAMDMAAEILFLQGRVKFLEAEHKVTQKKLSMILGHLGIEEK